MGPIKRGIVNLTNNLNNLNRKYIKNTDFTIIIKYKTKFLKIILNLIRITAPIPAFGGFE